MPKQIAQNELDAIIHIVSKFPEGIALGKIVENLAIPLVRRNVELISSQKLGSLDQSSSIFMRFSLMI